MRLASLHIFFCSTNRIEFFDQFRSDCAQNGYVVWFCCFWVRFDCVGLCVVFASVRLRCGCCGFLCVPVIRCSALLELFALLFYVVFCLFSFYFSFLFILIFKHSYFASSLPSSPLLLRRLFLFFLPLPLHLFLFSCPVPQLACPAYAPVGTPKA